MHPIMMADPNSRILPGQVALRYMKKVDLMRDVVEQFLEFTNRKASDAIPLREAEHLR